MTGDRDELAVRLKQRAYLEGDFLLRSGKRSKYYLDKYRFETQPDLLEEIGARIAALVAREAPDVDGQHACGHGRHPSVRISGAPVPHRCGRCGQPTRSVTEMTRVCSAVRASDAGSPSSRAAASRPTSWVSRCACSSRATCATCRTTA